MTVSVFCATIATSFLIALLTAGLFEPLLQETDKKITVNKNGGDPYYPSGDVEIDMGDLPGKDDI